MESVNHDPGFSSRPGGIEITNRAFSFCSFPSGSRILDLGCGSGDSVNFLRESCCLDAFGIDVTLPNTQNSPYLTEASAEAIPFPPGSTDGVLMECSFSLMANPAGVLRECHRVLKTDGRLIISDMYALGIPAVLNGCLGRLESRENIEALMGSNGFSIELFEDYSHQLRALWGQVIFDRGIRDFYCSLGVDSGVLRSIRCGYYLMICKKSCR